MTYSKISLDFWETEGLKSPITFFIKGTVYLFDSIPNIKQRAWRSEVVRNPKSNKTVKDILTNEEIEEMYKWIDENDWNPCKKRLVYTHRDLHIYEDYFDMQIVYEGLITLNDLVKIMDRNYYYSTGDHYDINYNTNNVQGISFKCDTHQFQSMHENWVSDIRNLKGNVFLNILPIQNQLKDKFQFLHTNLTKLSKITSEKPNELLIQFIGDENI